MLDRAGRQRFALLALLSLIQTIMEVVSVSLVLPFAAMVASPEIITASRALAAVDGFFGHPPHATFMAGFGLALFALILVKNIQFMVLNRLQWRLLSGRAGRVSSDLVSRYVAAPYEFHLEHNSAKLITVADTYVEQLFLVQVMPPALMLASEALTVTGLAVLLLIVETKLVLLLCAVIGGAALVLALGLRRTMVRLGAIYAPLRARRLQTLQQVFSSIKEIKVQGREAYFLEEYRQVRDSSARAQARIQATLQVSRPVLEVLVTGGIVLVIVMVLLQGRGNADIVGTLALFAMSGFRILPGVTRIISAYHTLKNGAPMVDALVADRADPDLAGGLRGNAPAAMPFERAVEVESVSFAYASSGRDVLEDVSLSIAKGEAIGLVGPSGAGKSTLVDILLGLLPPQRGRVLVDGRDIATDPRAWRRLVGYVPQTISLIDDSLRQNVAFGIKAEAIDDAKVWRALQLAHVDEFVRALPAGLDTAVGERGVRLSGGQRQRIGIARALYDDPEVLVLDEATAALDNETEREVTRAIEGLHGRKTLIVIAHRLSTVKRCDRLVLMKAGRVEDTGRFQDLVASNPDFRDLVRMAALGAGEDEERLIPNDGG